MKVRAFSTRQATRMMYKKSKRDEVSADPVSRSSAISTILHTESMIPFGDRCSSLSSRPYAVASSLGLVVGTSTGTILVSSRPVQGDDQ